MLKWELCDYSPKRQHYSLYFGKVVIGKLRVENNIYSFRFKMLGNDYNQIQAKELLEAFKISSSIVKNKLMDIVNSGLTI